MKNQYFQIFTFSINSFQELIFLCFCSTFSSQNLWCFSRRDLSLSEPFLRWLFMVWAPIWLPKPSRRPSKRHPKRTLNFETHFYWFLPVLGTPWSTQNHKKMLGRTLMVVPFWLQKRLGKNWAPRCDFKAFWLPKLVLWHPQFAFLQRFLSIFCIFLGFRTSNSVRHRLPNNALAK